MRQVHTYLCHAITDLGQDSVDPLGLRGGEAYADRSFGELEMPRRWWWLVPQHTRRRSTTLHTVGPEEAGGGLDPGKALGIGGGVDDVNRQQ